MSTSGKQRVLSGMRPTGQLHLGHYHGVLKNWLDLQQEYECFFFVADWHALTTEYEDPSIIEKSVWDMVIDWLAVGINPGSAKLFIQSRVPEHAELHLLLGMSTPLSWLERVPSYKDQQEKLSNKDLTTYGFLGYPLLQTADIIMYKAGHVPVGEDQVSHVELAREVVRRFNHLYGREPDFEEKVKAAAKKMGKKNARLYYDLRRSYQEQGDATALEKARALLEAQQNISIGDRERLSGYLDGSGKAIFPEPQALLTPTSKMMGLDGQKMSKSYGNTISLRENPSVVEEKIRTMPTDPARVRLTDPGEPSKCPVWNLHQVYSDDDLKEWVVDGCTKAKIGCLDCKKPLIESVLEEQGPIRERANEYINDPETVRGIIADGCDAARDIARETLEEVRDAMGLIYR
ncbi:MAG TPA: tryptophan--tRNA ligase [Thiotrichaceae bacterium]|nr:tryptophan--tRNA ligase [Thiotrichaceae bacterium]HIM07804.1 tryptophan--tRNA ligase [Gammaproteobacteria bacterium]